jgi:iron complex outermembrane recepter protein
MNKFVAAALLTGAALPAMPAFAQTGAEEGLNSGEIIVTARRREENLQDVPIAIAALGQADLEQKQINTEADLQRAVPGLTIRAAGSANQFNFSIRGQSVDTYTNSPPSVLVYTNEAQVVTRAATSFYDISGIQVLKGPQGTLFGRNATGGAVLIETAKPKDRTEGYLLARYSSYDLFRAEGAVSLPFSDSAALRLAGYYEVGGAFVDNQRTGRRLGKQDLGSVRGTLVLRPSDSIENTTVVQHTSEGGDNVPTLLYSAYACGERFNGVPLNSTADCVYGPADVFGAFTPYRNANPNIFQGGVNAAADRQRAWGPWRTETGVPLWHDAKSTFVINTTQIDLGDSLKLKNIFMWNRSNAEDGFTYDGSPYSIFQIFGTFNTGQTTMTDRKGFIQKTRQVSNELQLQGTAADGKLDFVTGLYYLDQQDENDSWLLAFDFTPIARGSLLRYHALTTAESIAAFGQFTYALTDALKFTGGLRWTWEKATSRQLPGSVFGTTAPRQTLKDNKPSWNVSLDYKVSPDVLLYVSHRGSWRAGSFNYSVPPIDATADRGGNRFNSETTKDIEIGLKYSGEGLGVPVTFNTAGFIQWVDKIQRAAYVPEPSGTPSLVTTNVPKAKIQGFEAALTVKAAPWLDFGLSGAYTDAKYTDNLVILPNSVGVFTPTRYGPFADVPKWSGTAFVEARHDLGGDTGELSFRLDVYSQTEFSFSNVGATLAPETDIAGYALVNARIAWSNVNGSGITAAVFARNLFNREYYAGGNSIGATLGLNTSVPGRPRIFGGEVRLAF